MQKLLLILTLTISVLFAQDYTMTPTGDYVAGSNYTMTPDGDYLGNGC